MTKEVLENAKISMEKSVESLKKDYQTLRTGRVSPKILEGINVDYYGAPTPINAVATVTLVDANTINIMPWEKKMLKELQNAISGANIGVTPNNNGEGIILSFPPMTTEQRGIIAKQAKAMTENAKVAVRNIRKDANNKISKLEKDKAISEDESKKAQNDVQKLTDDFIKKVDETFKFKEAEILKV
ncbi:MAG: ribosome recycling factor [Helicobacteraceae bacterium]